MIRFPVLFRTIFVAKKKATRKKRTVSRPKRSYGPFWADALLALFYLLNSLVLVVGIILLAAMGLSVESALRVRQEILRQGLDPDVTQQLNSLDQTKGIALGIIALGLLPILYFLLRGIWNGRRWALIIVLLIEAGNVVLMLMSTKNETRIGAILPIIVAVYCLLRFLGAVGPKMK